MRILLWHVHGRYTTSLVHGRTTTCCRCFPTAARTAGAARRPGTGPPQPLRCTPGAAGRRAEIDLVVLQRPHELALVREWPDRTPGRDLAAVYLEHNAPEPHPVTSRHPLADDRATTSRSSTSPISTGCSGTTVRRRTHVIEHSVVDPGDRYTGELPHAAVVVNEPVRRNRMVGTDLLGELGRPRRSTSSAWATGPIPGTNQLGDDRPGPHARASWRAAAYTCTRALDLARPVADRGDAPRHADRRVAATEVPRAVPPAAGVVSADPSTNWPPPCAPSSPTRTPRAPPARRARAHALSHYGLDRFLAEWDRVFGGGGAMRIAMVSEHASPLAVLGRGRRRRAERARRRAGGAACAARGHDVTVFTRRDDPDLPERVPMGPGVIVEHLDAGPAEPLPKDDLLQYVPEMCGELITRLDCRRPDVLHAHFWMSGLAALGAARRSDVPMVQTFHALGAVKRRYQGAGRHQPADAHQQRAQPGPARRPGCSPPARTSAARCCASVRGRRRVDIVPSGVDLDRVLARRPGRPGLREVATAVVCGAAGAAQGRRRRRSASSPSCPEVELVMAGGPGRGPARRRRGGAAAAALAAELGVADRVRLVGSVGHEAAARR